MTVIRQNFENSTVGASATTGGTAGGNSAVGAIGTAPVITNTAGEVINNTLSAKAVAASGASSGLTLATTGFTGGKVGAYVVLRFLDASLGAVDQVLSIRSAAGKCAVFSISASRVVTVVNAAGSTVATLPTALAFPGVYIFELVVDTGTSTSDGKIKYGVRNFSDGLFTAGMSAYVELTAANAGAGVQPPLIQTGWLTTAAAARNMVIDDIYIVDSYSTTGPSVNIIPTVASDGVVTIGAGVTTATITGFGDDSDGTISNFTCAYRPGTGLNVSTMATTPTIGPVTITSGAGTAHATFSFAVSGLTDGRAFFDIYAVDNLGANSLVGTARINKTELAPIRTGTTLVSITKITPAGGTNSGALNAQSTVPVLFETASPPTVGSLFQEAFQPIDLNGDITFGQTWNIKNDATTIVPTTVWVDLKEGGINGTVRATATASINSYTPTFVGRTTTPAETASITDRSNLAVVGRFA